MDYNRERMERRWKNMDCREASEIAVCACNAIREIPVILR